MWETEKGREEVDSEAPSLGPVKVEGHQGGGEGLRGGEQKTLLLCQNGAALGAHPARRT